MCAVVDRLSSMMGLAYRLADYLDKALLFRISLAPAVSRSPLGHRHLWRSVGRAPLSRRHGLLRIRRRCEAIARRRSGLQGLSRTCWSTRGPTGVVVRNDHNMILSTTFLTW